VKDANGKIMYSLWSIFIATWLYILYSHKILQHTIHMILTRTFCYDSFLKPILWWIYQLFGNFFHKLWSLHYWMMTKMPNFLHRVWLHLFIFICWIESGHWLGIFAIPAVSVGKMQLCPCFSSCDLWKKPQAWLLNIQFILENESSFILCLVFKKGISMVCLIKPASKTPLCCDKYWPVGV